MRYIPRPPQNPTRICDRCNLQTPKDSTDCIHCSNLSDIGLHDMLQKHQEQLEANKKLAHFFIIAAIIISILMYITTF